MQANSNDEYSHTPQIFPQGAGHFSALVIKKKWYGTLSLSYKLEGRLELRNRSYDAGICRCWSPSPPMHELPFFPEEH